MQKAVSPQLSNEVYLLQKYRWLILSSISNIKYHADPRMDSHFRCLMNTYDYEDALFRIDLKLKDFRDLKELYIQFNNRNGGTPIEARKEIYKDPIINSFIMVEKHGHGKVYDNRLSNGLLLPGNYLL